ncbi:MAG: hypothetical protein ACPGSL_00490 [Vicingaceae bacterium]
MLKHLTFLLSSLLIVLNCFAQDDYVISNPNKKPKKTELEHSKHTKIPNPDNTSYFLNSTANTLKKKQIRLSGTDAVFMKGSYGITNNTMASVNISLFGTATAAIKQQINISNNVKLGASVSGGVILFQPSDPNHYSDRDTNIYIGGGQAMCTLGDQQDNLTVGVGMYYLKGTFDITGSGDKELFLNNIYVGFQKQISNKLYFMAEGMYFINYQIFTGAFGVKLVVGDRIALNFGLMPLGFNNPSSNNTEIPVALPLISFRILLGKR